MTRHIVVAIEPHEDGVRCGECMYSHDPQNDHHTCWIWAESCGIYYDEKTRCKSCLAAEAKLTALISAGNSMNNRYCDGADEEWDRAVAEMRK